ncbi:serine carboxypeptidase-like 42 [Selaginella moellendorffii]|nr:serine carboxypeptidase-like 42 [Selaginella moellendorffii]|eukprot:XP_002990798.2 serine carboxypeptidase-like 42 [Selaginella moellendorffii]
MWRRCAISKRCFGMDSVRTKLLLLLLLGIQGKGALGAPEHDLVTNLPGQPAVPFKQYAGYVTVDSHAGRALFYYFVEAHSHASSKPLALWLNGGPGCSSIGGGAFTELGPFYPNGTGRGLVKNSNSWNKAANILFLESPAGVGWSYSNRSEDYSIYNDAKTAKDSVTFLLRWFDAFPEYKSREFYITGESYAGHYVPQLAAALLDYNKAAGHSVFNVKGIAIGNPALNLAIDTASTYDFLWSHGLISDKTYEGLGRSCYWSDYDHGSGNNNVSAECNQFISNSALEMGDHVNPYDIILDVCVPSIVEQEFRLKKRMGHRSIGVDVCMSYERYYYFNLPEVQKALHANTTGLPYPWTNCDGPVQYDINDMRLDIVPVLRDLLKNGLRVWVFSGDEDAVVPFLGTRVNVNSLAQELKLRTTASYKAWFLRTQVGGWAESFGNLTFATVRGAAHMVPLAQPARALLLFQKFISGQPLPASPYS